MALMRGDEWVETTEDVVKYFLPKGTGEPGFFCYRGIKVCVGDPASHGKVPDEIQERLDEQMGSIIHGKEEGKLLGI